MKTKNKILAFGIILCMLFAMAIVPAHAAIVDSGTCGENLTWTLDDEGTLTISGTGDMTDYSYPDYAPWYSLRSSIETVIIQNGVTSIGGSAFYYCGSLVSVTIPDSVTSIGDEAFEYCGNLTSVTIPNSVTSIGAATFYGCRNLTGINIGNSVTSIGFGAFQSCFSLTSLTIPDSVTSIEGTFYGCGASIISIGNGVTSIGVYGFEDFYGTTIRIGNGVTSIDGRAFSCCPNLTEIEVSQNNQNYSSENGVLFNKDKITLIACPRGKTGSYTIPDSVTSIGDYAFSGCDSLRPVIIPSGVTSIGDYAFFNCGSLRSITIPNSVTSIGAYAFWGCQNLTSISMGNGVTSIGGGAFSDCNRLSDIYYSGSSSQWNDIIKSGNDYLKYATIYYNETAVTISETDCTDDSIKLVSHMIINSADTPVAFGTTFIPLWLFSDPSATPATVEYSVSEYPVVSGDTFGATLAGIPDGYQDVYFVGKSYIRLDDESVVWSNAKKVKIEENALRKVE